MAEAKRKLAAILAADVAGYSRLMGDDERATVATLNAYRDVFKERIEARNGRVVDTAGDSVLAVFHSVVEAVQCALDVQAALDARNADLPEKRRMRFRIGVNLGDIIEQDDGTVYGDGVNIAARLESLCNPGGLTLSESAHMQVRGKVDNEFEDIGPQQVKNMSEPIRAYRMRPDDRDGTPPIGGKRQALLVPLGRPSIAVLPFTNMSGDPEQEYFADGITEDIITELARFQNIFVIARNSTFAWKGRSVRVQDVARDLGVTYVVEGSVRRGGNRVRVTVQLIEAQTGNHVWAERYDRDLSDIFELQDELTKTIASALPGRLETADIEKIKRKPPHEMSVYDRILRAKLLHHRGTHDDNTEAMRLLDSAIASDPEFAPAYGWRACTLGQAMACGYVPATSENEDKIYEDVLKGLSVDDNDAECIRIQCEFRIVQRRIDEALMLNDKALRLNPNDPRLHAQRGEVLGWAGRPEEGIESLNLAMRLDPYESDGWAHLLGRNCYDSGRYAEAIDAFKRVTRERYWHHAYLAACYAHLGDDYNAAIARAECLKLKPDFRASDYCATLFYQDNSRCSIVREGMVLAGLADR
jgi:adenylate cyclase